MTISVPDSVYDLYNEGVDYFISSSFGINCKLVYPPLKTNCENCITNLLPGVGASNVYKAGGPYPFTEGVCPYCSGLGYKITESSTIIKVRSYFDQKSWTKFSPKIAYKDGDAVLIGYMTDLPKFQHIAYIQLASDMKDYIEWNYELSTEPVPWGFKKNRYFSVTVSRVNGKT